MKKAGFVALIGEPNAGKSTLLNHFVGSNSGDVSRQRTRLQNNLVPLNLVPLDLVPLNLVPLNLEKYMKVNYWL